MRLNRRYFETGGRLVQRFVAGFVIALLAVVPPVVWFFCTRTRRRRARNSGCVGQLEELSKLTGELAHEIKNPLSTIKVNLELVTEELKGPGKNDQTAARASGRLPLFKRKRTDSSRFLMAFCDTSADLSFSSPASISMSCSVIWLIFIRRRLTVTP